MTDRDPFLIVLWLASLAIAYTVGYVKASQDIEAQEAKK